MKSILLVDDDVEMSNTISAYLTWNGFNVDCVSNFSDVFKFLENKKCDLLIIDALINPGWEVFCAKLRKLGKKVASKMPVLLIASEVLDTDQLTTLSRLEIHFLLKFRKIQDWVNVINNITGSQNNCNEK